MTALGLTLLIFAAAASGVDRGSGLKVDLALPEVRSWAPPVYPREAAARRLAGVVTVRFIVDKNGTVTKARALQSADKIFDAAAVRSVLQWRFKPALDGGQPVAKCMDVTLPFDPGSRGRRMKASSPPAKVLLSLAAAPYVRAAKVSGGDPSYPDSLLSRYLPGEVDVKLRVNRDGRARITKILWATHPDFILPALAAVSHWRFRPAHQGDLVVPATMESALEFDVLNPKGVDVLAANGITLRNALGTTYDMLPGIRLLADPVYPYNLRLAGTQGEATADFTIGVDGRTRDITVRKAARPDFGQALAAAVACWWFDPAQKNGTPVAVKAAAHWRFSLAPNSPEYDATERLVQLLRGHDTAALGPKGLDGRLAPRDEVPPVYPEALVEKRRAGEAQITFIIDRTGRCRLARIVSATQAAFGWAAATAIERWVFTPPTRSGRPADVEVSIPFTFSPPAPGGRR